ncbi:15979_t:CDS:2 [Funneliformis caledonium]|uniref:15979_t:CDS:1 n=1 Tax=Funneliformis caledonium TaxID=1117310 RepID=A0A9N8VYP2_9GLOM|nr:15979_t:CDS:2 [Funneliformis caledonium]
MSTYSSIQIEGEGRPSSAGNTIFENNVPIDRSPLLSGDIVIEDENDYEGEGPGGAQHGFASYYSCAINLANTILGTGMLAMPAAIASVGLLIGSIMIIFAATTSGLGLYFLSRSASYTKNRNASFFAVSQLTYPSASSLFDASIAIKCFGVAVSYLIIIGDLMPQVINGFGDSFVDEYSIFMDRRFWITVFMFVVVPLAFLKRLDSLRHTSFIALIAVVYLVFIVIYHYFGPDYKAPPKEKIHLVKFSTKFFTNLPIFVFAFTCHQNIFSIYNELADNSQKNINSVIVGAIGTSATIYQVIGILGYLSFGDDVLPNVILMSHPARACLEKLLFYRSNSTNGYKKLSSSEMSNVNYFGLTSGILIFSYIIAISVSKLDLVLAFVGSTGSTAISFILPGLYYYKIHENDPWDKRKILAACLIIYGLCVMTICLTLNIVKVSS